MSRGNRGGRPKKPTAIKDLQGNPGHRPNNEDEPKFKGRTTPPAHLDKTARQEWKRLRPRLELLEMLTPADRTAFAAYCVAYSRHVAAEKFLQSPRAGGSLKYVTATGALRPWPEVAISNSALQQMHRFITEFGLTPASRSRLHILPPGKPNTDEDFLFGNEEESDTDECEDDAAN
jgi:P27 family predicted phage terminase small subunit